MSDQDWVYLLELLEREGIFANVKKDNQMGSNL